MVAKLIPQRGIGRGSGIVQGELRQLYQKDEEIRDVIDYSRKSKGVRHASIHAAGLVI